MTNLTIAQAVDLGIAAEMRQDPSVIFLGEGVATKRREMVLEFGTARVRNTPISEATIAGMAAGAAASGLKPVVDMLFAPFLLLSMDAIANSAGKLRYISGGQFSFPMVLLAMTGAGWSTGAQHNHNLEAIFAHLPGIKVYAPATAECAYSMIRQAIRDPNPVVFILDIALLHQPQVFRDGSAFSVGTSGARIARTGQDVTLVAYGKTVGVCMDAAAQLEASGVQAEVVDLRFLKPLDTDAVLASVSKTGHLVAVQEAAGICSIASEICASVSEKAFSALRSAPVRITGADAPVGASEVIEAASVPLAGDVARAALQAVQGERQASGELAKAILTA